MFTLSDTPLQKVNKYRYLGLSIDYKLDYKVTADAVAKSANRALGLLISKSKSLGGLSYNCFSKLYESSVMSVIRYGAAIWGNKEFSCINTVHNRMCRYYLGVGKFTPNAAVQGDIGLRVPWQHQKVEICRHYCRLVNISGDRLNKNVFKWCNRQNVKNWNFRVRSYLRSIDQDELTNIERAIDKDSFLNVVKECTEVKNEEQWLHDVTRENSRCKKGKNKLRT